MVRMYIVGALMLIVPQIAIAGKNSLPELLSQYKGPSQRVLRQLNKDANNPKKQTSSPLSLSEIGNTQEVLAEQNKLDKDNNPNEQTASPLSLSKIVNMQDLLAELKKLDKDNSPNEQTANRLSLSEIRNTEENNRHKQSEQDTSEFKQGKNLTHKTAEKLQRIESMQQLARKCVSFCKK